MTWLYRAKHMRPTHFAVFVFFSSCFFATRVFRMKFGPKKRLAHKNKNDIQIGLERAKIKRRKKKRLSRCQRPPELVRTRDPGQSTQHTHINISFIPRTELIARHGSILNWIPFSVNWFMRIVIDEYLKLKRKELLRNNNNRKTNICYPVRYHLCTICVDCWNFSTTEYLVSPAMTICRSW